MLPITMTLACGAVEAASIEGELLSSGTQDWFKEYEDCLKNASSDEDKANCARSSSDNLTALFERDPQLARATETEEALATLIAEATELALGCADLTPEECLNAGSHTYLVERELLNPDLCGLELVNNEAAEGFEFDPVAGTVTVSSFQNIWGEDYTTHFRVAPNTYEFNEASDGREGFAYVITFTGDGFTQLDRERGDDCYLNRYSITE